MQYEGLIIVSKATEQADISTATLSDLANIEMVQATKVSGQL
jgi:hypothetical protein